MPNAFATGRNPKNSAVAVTTGLWDRLDKREIEGVLAHELSHIANRDVLVMTLASFFAMLAGLLARFGLYGGMLGGGDRDRGGGAPVWLIVFLVSIATYILSYILIRTISRYREYAADRGAAIITGAPENLMSALQRIASGMASIPQRDLRQVESMNAFFIIPTGVKSALGELFATHPPLEKRLARLAEIVARDGPRGRVVQVWASRRPVRAPEAEGRIREKVFALSTARITLEAELGLKSAGAAAVCFKPLSAGEFVRAENELQELLDTWPRRPARGSAAAATSTGSSG